MDAILVLPDHLIDLIFEKLPVIDRLKTSILFHWTYSPSLILDERFYFSDSRFRFRWVIKYEELIESLVLQHKSPPLKLFSLYIHCDLDPYRDIYQRSIYHVMQINSLERLLLRGVGRNPSFLLDFTNYSMPNLSRLEIKSLVFLPPSNPFPNLTRFVLGKTNARAGSISRFVSTCPRLEELGLEEVCFNGRNLDIDAPRLTHLWVDGNYISIFVLNAPNLKSISMSFHSIPRVAEFSSAKMFSSFNNSLQLRSISLNSCFCQVLGRCKVIQRLPIFDQMTRLNFYDLDLNDPVELRCLLTFCGCSPNAKELSLSTYNTSMAPGTDPQELESMTDRHIKDNLGKLVKVNLRGIEGLKVEMKIIELLLRFSPNLEVMHIDFDSSSFEDGKGSLLKDAVKSFYTASTQAKICFNS